MHFIHKVSVNKRYNNGSRPRPAHSVRAHGRLPGPARSFAPFAVAPRLFSAPGGRRQTSRSGPGASCASGQDADCPRNLSGRLQHGAYSFPQCWHRHAYHAHCRLSVVKSLRALPPSAWPGVFPHTTNNRFRTGADMEQPSGTRLCSYTGENLRLCRAPDCALALTDCIWAKIYS